MILYFDTAGTDFWDFKLERDDPRQPHLLRLAVLQSDPPVDYKPECFLLRPPQDVAIAPKAQEFHRVSLEHARSKDDSPFFVMDRFQLLLNEAELAVAFNLQSHMRIMDRAAASVGRTLTWPETMCAMIKSADIVKARLQKNNRWAWPKHEVAHEYFTGVPLELSPDPIETGLAMVRSVAVIHRGIVAGHA